MKPDSLSTIFLVDDDKFYLNLYEKWLLNLGYTNIHKFEYGMDCIENLNLKPDLIILDYCMDFLNGKK